MRQSTRESVLESCNNVQMMSATTAAKIAQGWRDLAVFSRQLNPHNTDLHTVYDKLAEMFDARADEAQFEEFLGVEFVFGGLELLGEEFFTARESYDDATRGTFDVEGRVRS